MMSLLIWNVVVAIGVHLFAGMAAHAAWDHRVRWRNRLLAVLQRFSLRRTTETEQSTREAVGAAREALEDMGHSLLNVRIPQDLLTIDEARMKVAQILVANGWQPDAAEEKAAGLVDAVLASLNLRQ